MGYQDTNSRPEYVLSMPLKSMSVPQHILPYGQKVTVKDNGYATECWIWRCYKMPPGEEHKYEGQTCGGDTIKFTYQDILVYDMTTMPPPQKTT